MKLCNNTCKPICDFCTYCKHDTSEGMSIPEYCSKYPEVDVNGGYYCNDFCCINTIAKEQQGVQKYETLD